MQIFGKGLGGGDQTAHSNQIPTDDNQTETWTMNTTNEGFKMERECVGNCISGDISLSAVLGLTEMCKYLTIY